MSAMSATSAMSTMTYEALRALFERSCFTTTCGPHKYHEESAESGEDAGPSSRSETQVGVARQGGDAMARSKGVDRIQARHDRRVRAAAHCRATGS